MSPTTVTAHTITSGVGRERRFRSNLTCGPTAGAPVAADALYRPAAPAIDRIAIDVMRTDGAVGRLLVTL